MKALLVAMILTLSLSAASAMADETYFETEDSEIAQMMNE